MNRASETGEGKADIQTMATAGQKKIVARSSSSISMTSGRAWHRARVVAEFQSGAANQVINHSGGKGPSKNRLMRSRVNQVQASLPSPRFAG